MLGWFGALRCGKFTCQGIFDPEFHLCVEDIQIGVTSHNMSHHMSLKLKCSKTDPFRQGCTIDYYETDEDLCPVTSMHKYMAMRQHTMVSKKEPLFLLPSRLALTRHMFIGMLRHMLTRLGHNSSHYSGHSLRKGLATTASSAGLEDHVIAALGRWTSDCYRIYIATPKTVIAKAQKSLACHTNI